MAYNNLKSAIKINRIMEYVRNIPISLQRVTSNGKYLPEVDGLRFLAIFWVVLFHLNGYVVGKALTGTLDIAYQKSPVYQLLSIGNRGVELLFVLTGFMFVFMIKRNLNGSPFLNLKKYYLRRITRLLPPLIISLFIWFFLEEIFISCENKPPIEMFGSLVASILQVHYLIYHQPSFINYPLWAFEIIMQFYLIAPLFVYIFRIRKNWLRWGLLVITMMLGELIKLLAGSLLPPYVIDGTIIRFIQWFICGILLADIYIYYSSLTKHWFFDLIGLLSWISIVFVAHVSLPKIQEWVLLVVILPAFYSVFRGPFLNRIFTNRWIVSLGGICFSIYLYHYLLISSVGRLLNPYIIIQNYNIRFMAYFIVIMPAVVISGIILYLLFERPFMDQNWPKKLLLFLQRLFDNFRLKIGQKTINLK